MDKQIETFFFNPAIKVLEEGKWLLAVRIFEATDSAFNQTEEINIFSITKPSCWTLKDGGKTINKLVELLVLRSQKAFEFHVQDFMKKQSIRNRKWSVQITRY